MRVLAVLALPAAIFAGACDHHSGAGTGGNDGGTGGTPDACVGIGCDVTDCRAMGKPDTTISGTVFAPNGTLPLFGINVYVPATDPGPLTAGAVCSRCADPLPGNPVVQAASDERGTFSLIGVPSGDNIPVVITSGKWRKIITLPHVDACSQVALTTDQTSLPKTHLEGDIPQMAITTGQADSLECLVRKLGIADSEITTDTGGGRVHLYGGMLGQSKFIAGFPGGDGQTFSDAQTLWNDADKMKAYDILFFSCEGAQYAETKPQAAMDNVKAYADLGGRVFATHWHNIWLEPASASGVTQQAAPAWTSIGTWTNRDPSELNANSSAYIDEVANPKGMSFAEWMLNNGGSTTRDQILLQNQPPDPMTGDVLSTGRTSLATTDPNQTERWVYLKDQGMGTQNFQFTTPIEQDDVNMRCGKFVFSDMHVSGTSNVEAGDYPDSCGPSLDMTPQEKALAFMFFDIASCVGTLF